MKKRIKEMYFHIKGTPKQDEAYGRVTDNYVWASLVYYKGRGYYLSTHRCGRYIFHDDYSGEDVKMENFTVGDSQSLYEWLVLCNRASKAKEREAVELFDSYIFTVVRERLGYDTDLWEVKTS